MQNKRYLLCVVFLLIVVQTISINVFKRKDIKNKDNDDDDDDDNILNIGKHNRLNNDYHSESLTQRRNRYPPYGLLSNNYRSRSRWPSSYDDRFDLNDWSSYGHGHGINNLLSKFSGPLLPPAFENDPYINNGPNCYSLLDSQYPLFSDICGAVPQARYSLPNSFGHLERWQIAQTLTVILGPSSSISSNPTCTRSLRLLLCPLLFPPCPTRYEAPPVLPCQPFCRVVKNQCASPSLELLPCDLLPPSSDLCPINPTPYSSLLSSYGQPLPFNGGLSPTGLPQSALSSLLAQSAFQSGLSPSDIPPSAFLSSPYSSTLTPSGVPTSPISSLLSSLSSLASADSFNMADSLTPILVDFPPIQYAQASRYFPATRSAIEQV